MDTANVVIRTVMPFFFSFFFSTISVTIESRHSGIYVHGLFLLITV